MGLVTEYWPDERIGAIGTLLHEPVPERLGENWRVQLDAEPGHARTTLVWLLVI